MNKRQIRRERGIFNRINLLHKCAGLEKFTDEVRLYFLRDWSRVDFTHPQEYERVYLHYRNVVDSAFRDWYDRRRVGRAA